MAPPKDIHRGLTTERLKSLLVYDSETGDFRWQKNICRKKCRPGGIAGSLRSDGSWRIRIDGWFYCAHRLAWLYMTGAWPIEEIDHIDRVRKNNKWSNLRAATRLQNQINVVIKNSTGYSNVDAINGRFRARARINGVTKHLGMADTAKEAHALSVKERRKFYGDFVVSQIGDL